MKLQPQVNKKRRDNNGALAKHRQFLARLSQSKIEASEENMLKGKLTELKTQNFKARAAEQRDKINNLKATDDLLEEA